METLKKLSFRWLILAAIFVAILEFFSLAGIRFPRVVAIPLYAALILVIGHETLLKGVKALLKLQFRSINLLMLIAVVGAFYLEEYPEAAVVIVLFTLAEQLEHIGISKSKSALDHLVDQMPKNVVIKGKANPIPLDQVQVDDLILIKPFEMIPLDGEVSKGVSFVDESTITGEPIPKDKREGDPVFACTLNQQGNLEVRVTKLQKETTFAKIRELTFKATQNKAETQKFIERFSSYYTPSIIALALLWVLTPLLFQGVSFSDAFAQSLTLLVIGCPCALVISTPISIYSAIGKASTMGALIKGGRFLEALGRMKAVAFDKTRTLTYGKPVVTDTIPFGSQSKETLLSCAAGIEQLSEHPLAQSVVEAAQKEDFIPHEVENFESIVGKGAKADCLICDDTEHYVGKLAYILEEHQVPQEVIDTVHQLQSQGKTLVIVSTKKEVEGVIAIEDEIRSDSAALIQALKKQGITSVMLTGDHTTTAHVVAQAVGIDQVKAELLPEHKAETIDELVKQYGVVGMVGDGVNDAPALAKANVGITMSSLGSDTAIEAASVVILNDKLELIPYLVDLGRRTLKMIKFNTLFAVGIKFLVVGLALVGWANLALAIFADVGVTVLVILNSLRLMR